MTSPQMVLERIDDTDFSDLTDFKGFHMEPRCRVCRNPALCRKVNDMLTTGASYAMVLRALTGDNDKLDKRDRVTIDSIRNHASRHFPVQNAAQATYRVILEQRAKENGVDFIMGVATAITPMAFYETVMVKGYETLVDSNTTVDVTTGMIAAGRLQALLDSRASGLSTADMWVQLNQIINAVKDTVPKELWPEIQSRVNGGDGTPQPAADNVDDFDSEEDRFDDGDLDE